MTKPCAVKGDKAQAGGAQRGVTGGQPDQHQRFADQADDLHRQDADERDAVPHRMHEAGMNGTAHIRNRMPNPRTATSPGTPVNSNRGGIIGRAKDVRDGGGHVGDQDGQQRCFGPAGWF